MTWESLCAKKQNGSGLLSLPEHVDFVNGIFGAHVLKDAFVNLRITDEAIAADGSAVAGVLADRKSRPSIFVDAFLRVCENLYVFCSGAGA